MHPVLDAVQPLVERARDVRIDEARLRDVASWLAYEELPVPPAFLPVRVPAEHVADLVFVASCLNFAFTDFETRVRWDFEGRADADGLHVALWREGPSLLHGETLAVMTTERLGEILPGLQMLDERAAILRDVGAVLVERWDGRFANALASVADATDTCVSSRPSSRASTTSRSGSWRSCPRGSSTSSGRCSGRISTG